MKTCLHRLFGECKECEENYNPEYHLNNYDCSNYQEINIIEIETIRDLKGVYHAMD